MAECDTDVGKAPVKLRGKRKSGITFVPLKGHTLCCEQYTLELPIYPKTQKCSSKSIYSVGIFKLFL